MKQTTNHRMNGIQWDAAYQEDLDFDDDLTLLSIKQKYMQVKMTQLAAALEKVGLLIHKENTKHLKIHTAIEEPVKLGGTIWRR